MISNYFQWDEDFYTGNDVVDEQHYCLVNMVNDLLKMSLRESDVDIDTIAKLKSKIEEYVVVHFSTEERLMAMKHVDARHIEKHKVLHDSFVKHTNEYFSDLEKLCTNDKINEVVEYLVRWLAYHILNTDKSLIRQIQAIDVQHMTPEEAYEKEEISVELTAEPLLKALKALYFIVSEKNKQLEEKNAELEEKVKLRTAELIEANEILKNISIMDKLTGLPNRRFVMEELKRQIDNNIRYGTDFSVLFIDVDKFKGVNDLFGHEKGDEVLKWIAMFLKANTRQNDFVCRLGGDEFFIICPHIDLEAAKSIGDKLSFLLHAIKDDKITDFWLPSLSIGVSQFINKSDSASELIKNADDAMYNAKKTGGGKVC